MTIAIDGPAASGKGTLARKIAAEYGFHHLDTGLTYRATANRLLEKGLPLDDETAAVQAAREIEIAKLDRRFLADHAIGEAASKIAVMPGVRKVLVEKQRAFAVTPPGTVLDGRDIGTVVCPAAQVKLFVTASPEVRARRRHEEIIAHGGRAEYGEVLADIRQRDLRDSSREDSPLMPATGAHLLDTTEMDIEAAFDAAKTLIDRAVAAENMKN